MLMGVEEEDRAAVRRERLLDPALVFHGLPGRTRDEVLEELASHLAERGRVSAPGELVDRLLEREKLGCTGLGGGVAIPHCKWKDLDEVVVAVASTEHPVDFAAADGVPVSLVFLVVSPAQAPAAHLQTLARISRLLRTPRVVEGLRRAESSEKMLEVLREAEAGLPVAP
ncbi:MAG TPA: PTS sugar transporter subunit IIA [Thermoanaerobaculia bacterium]|jgi:PTS system nitrogen regulatory IIA component